jgi:hypothetical protein
MVPERTRISGVAYWYAGDDGTGGKVTSPWAWCCRDLDGNLILLDAPGEAPWDADCIQEGD